MAQHIGERIKFLREKKSLTKEELGNMLKLHSSTIGRIEKGSVYPNIQSLIKISQYFNVSCDWLLLGHNFKDDCIDANRFVWNNLYDELTNEQLKICYHFIRGYIEYENKLKSTKEDTSSEQQV